MSKNLIWLVVGANWCKQNPHSFYALKIVRRLYKFLKRNANNLEKRCMQRRLLTFGLFAVF